MSFYFFLYIIIIALFFYFFVFVLLKNKSFVWTYFFISIFCIFIWFLLYLISFSTTLDKDILIFYSRIMYWSSLVSMYSMLLFVLKYPSKKSLKNIDYFYIFLFVLVLSIVIFTPHILSDMTYDNDKKIYYEEYWSLYIIFWILYILFLPLFSLATFIKLKSLRFINKLRLKYIFWWFFTFMLLSLIFLVLLPILWIRVLEKEVVLFVIPFILSSWYSIQRYHFIDIKFWIWKIFIFFTSIFFSIILIHLIKMYFSNIMSDNLVLFWSYDNGFWITESIFSIILFVLIHKSLTKIILGDSIHEKFYNQLLKIKKQIPFITNINNLNYFLWLKFKDLFKIKNVNIHIFNKDNKDLEIFNFFDKNILNDLFINDIVFIEENKYKFDLNNIKKEIEKEIFLILPIRNNNMELIWIFSLWNQTFKDYYNTETINYLKEFVSFLEWHLKYLKIYNNINDLNLHLDKKVDEKTIEYNNLINKQKEFINMISHEIKWPIWSTLLQWECILDDIKDWKYDKEYLLKEVWIMNDELLKTWNLANKLFDIALYDVKDIKLYIEKIDLFNLLQFEVDIYKKNNKNIIFNLNINKDIWYINLDKVQFTQVIDNLLTNAVKFSQKDKGRININCFKENNKVFLAVEDNWTWFLEIDIANIFDKYSTWKSSWIWLWMWLYLCKKIVELHKWSIEASLSKDLWGAKFLINIPWY